ARDNPHRATEEAMAFSRRCVLDVKLKGADVTGPGGPFRASSRIFTLSLGDPRDTFRQARSRSPGTDRNRRRNLDADPSDRRARGVQPARAASADLWGCDRYARSSVRGTGRLRRAPR